MESLKSGLINNCRHNSYRELAHSRTCDGMYDAMLPPLEINTKAKAHAIVAMKAGAVGSVLFILKCLTKAEYRVCIFTSAGLHLHWGQQERRPYNKLLES